jgi:tetratricopeptide (TPR) repeat protein
MEPDEMPQPTNLEEYMRRGWAYHTHQREREAEDDFRKALELNADAVDTLYVLGLVLKAQNRNKEAVESFNRVVELLKAGILEDKIRAEMLRRLSLGHISELTEGDWNLEKEVWQRVY